MTDDEKLAALEKQKTDIKTKQLIINRKIRGVQSRKKSKARSDDTHAKIIAGALALEHAARNPGSEFGQVMFRLLDQYTRPEDRWLFDFLPPRDPPAETPKAAE